MPYNYSHSSIFETYGSCLMAARNHRQFSVGWVHTGFFRIGGLLFTCIPHDFCFLSKNNEQFLLSAHSHSAGPFPCLRNALLLMSSDRCSTCGSVQLLKYRVLIVLRWDFMFVQSPSHNIPWYFIISLLKVSKNHVQVLLLPIPLHNLSY